MKSVYFSISLAVLFQVVFSDKYLVYIPPMGGSHSVGVASAAAAMIERNHEITLLVADKYEEHVRKLMSNYTAYRVETYSTPVILDMETAAKKFTKSALEGNFLALYQQYHVLSNVTEVFDLICDDTLSDSQLMLKLKDHKFDLVFAHSIFSCSVLVAQYLGLRYVTLFDAIPPSLILRLHGNPVNPAYNPEMVIGFPERMTFLQRVTNSAFSFCFWLFGDLPIIPVNCFHPDKVKKKHNIKPELSMVEIVARTEILFISSHFVLDFPRALQPNVVQIGGMTARSPQPLTAVGL